MKKIAQYSIFIFVILFVTAVSCKKETPETNFYNPPPPPPPASPVVLNPHLVQFGILSEARYNIVAGAAGSKILFADGDYGENCFVPGGDYGDSIASVCLSNSTRVDIYDTNTHTWSIHELASLSPGGLDNQIFNCNS
jgi:hypothetical protein